MDNGTYEPKLNVIWEHIRGWVDYKHNPHHTGYTIIGCIAGALIDYHGVPVVSLGVSERNLEDEVNKKIGRELAIKRAMDRELLYKLHLPRYKMCKRLWLEEIQRFGYKCFLHFRKPVLFPKGIEFTYYLRRDIRQVDEVPIPTRGND